MNTLDQFEAELQHLIGCPTRVRPFVCEGSPLACRVFLVGANPATSLGLDFWRFWQSGYGFRKAEWLRAYTETRHQRGKKGYSPTRRILERVISAAAPVHCLETNIYAGATPALRDLSTKERETDSFDFLLRSVRPVAVVAHGSDAARHVQTLFGVELPTERTVPAPSPWGEVHLLAVPHFSRGWSYVKADQLGRDLQALAA